MAATRADQKAVKLEMLVCSSVDMKVVSLVVSMAASLVVLMVVVTVA